MPRKLSFKNVLKPLLLALGILFLLGLILGIIYKEDVKDWILDEIQEYVSEIQSGDLEIEEIELALFYNLPDVTVRLKKVKYYEHKDTLRTVGETPILTAENLNLSFEPWQLVRNQILIVNSVSIEKSAIDIIMYDDKISNLGNAIKKPVFRPKKTANKGSKLKKKPRKVITDIPATQKADQTTKSKVTPNSLEIDLRKIQFREMVFTYRYPLEDKFMQVDLALLDGNILLNPKGISCNLTSDFEIIENKSIPVITGLGPTSMELDVDFIEPEQKIIINDGNLGIEGFFIDLKGSYAHNNGRDLDLEFNASENGSMLFSKLLNEEVLKQNEALLQKADITMNGRLSGQLDQSPPMVDIDFGVKDLDFKVPEGAGNFENIGFKGQFHSSEITDYSKATLSIEDLKGQMPGGSVSGNFLLKNFLQPYLKCDVEASVLLDGFENIFQFTKIDSLQGRINLDAEFDGLINFEKEHEMDSLSRWSLNMEDIAFKYLPTNKTITKLNGVIGEDGNKVYLKTIGLNYENSDLSLDGEIYNLYHFIFKKEQEFEADLEIRSSRLFTKHFNISAGVNHIPLIDDRISNLYIDAKVSGRENNFIDTELPLLNIQLNHLSFELDKLPGIQNVQGLAEVYETKKGLSVDVGKMHAELQGGSADLKGNLVIGDNAELFEFNADMVVDAIPLEYVLDLIYEIKDLELLNSKTMSQNELTLVNGDLELSGTIDTTPFALQKATITNSNISIRKSDAQLYEAKKINLDIKGLYFLHEEGSNKITGVQSAEGNLNIDGINTPVFSNMPITLDFKGFNDIININFSNLRKVKNLDEGSLLLDLSKEPPGFELKYDLKDVAVGPIIEEYYSKKYMDGLINASVLLNGTVAEWNEMNKTIKGTLRLSGDTLKLYGVDIDDLLKKYKRSQTFDLLDVGAFVLAGPMGAVVSKGGDFGSLLGAVLKENDTTIVSRVLADWNIGNGILETEDVAFSTLANRIAFEGKYDIVNDSIPGFTAYVIDKNGCSLMEQKISGKVGDLEVGNLKIAKTLLGSVINFVNSVAGVKCELVYQGAVQHPIPVKKSN